MSSTNDEKDVRSRREFFRGVTGVTGATAMVAALSQMGVPVLNAAQGTQATKPDAIGGASRVAAPQTPSQQVAPDLSSGAKPKQAGGIKLPTTPEGQAISPFFRNPPPWPEGTKGNKYDYLFSTKLKEGSLMPEVIPAPQTYFRGDSDLPGAKINIGWQIFTQAIKLEMESHHHSVDEYQFYLGATFPDLVGSFDAEIEVFIGPKYEKHTINKATVLYLPAGLIHNPCDFRRVTKPVFFSSLVMSPFCSGFYQTMGYMAVKSGRKIT